MPPTTTKKMTQVPRARRRRRLSSQEASDAMVTSLTLPRPLHERARIAAIRLNWSYAEVIRVALVAWLDGHEPQALPRRANA